MLDIFFPLSYWRGDFVKKSSRDWPFQSACKLFPINHHELRGQRNTTVAASESKSFLSNHVNSRLSVAHGLSMPGSALAGRPLAVEIKFSVHRNLTRRISFTYKHSRFLFSPQLLQCSSKESECCNYRARTVFSVGLISRHTREKSDELSDVRKLGGFPIKDPFNSRISCMSFVFS